MSRLQFDDDDAEDRRTDRGPDGLRQARLPAAGFVRLVENPTPQFPLPPQRDGRTWRVCVQCDRFGPVDAWSIVCFECRPKRRREPGENPYD